MNSTNYRSHLSILQEQWVHLLDANGYDAAIVAAGTNPFYYDDDQNPPFHANPHLLRWILESDCENSVLVVSVSDEPKVLWFSPEDYWLQPPMVPEWVSEHFECELCSTLDELTASCKDLLSNAKKAAFLGPQPSELLHLACVEPASNKLIRQLAYRRAFKTEFEADCISAATEVGVSGHIAAREAFYSGGSEYEIHMSYLNASRQLETSLPYQSIVALNEHGSTIHYQHYDRNAPDPVRSLLIDAGGKHLSYHSDITRTYSRTRGDEFDSLINSIHDVQQQLISKIHSFENFVELHEHMHQLLAQVFVDHELVTCSAEAAYEQKLTDVFYPHGTGHLLGLQTHDLGGNITDADGATREPPNRFPSLRLLRRIEPRMVFTVEPGVYFIPLLLDQHRQHADVNWKVVDSFRPFGGIRIEDNVLIQEDGVHNFTRTTFALVENEISREEQPSESTVARSEVS